VPESSTIVGKRIVAMSFSKPISALWTVIVLGFSPVVLSDSFESIVNQTAPKLGGPELQRLKSEMAEAWYFSHPRAGLYIINTNYMIPGAGVLDSIGRTTSGKLLPSKNIINWSLEVDGKMPVNDASITEIQHYHDKISSQMEGLVDERKQLAAASRNAEGEKKKALRKEINNKRSLIGKKKIELNATKKMKLIFSDAKDKGIKKLYFSLIRGKSAVEISYNKHSNMIKNLKNVEKELAVKEPVILFDGGFYTFTKDVSQRPFSMYRKSKPKIKFQHITKLNDIYEFWNRRCAILRNHESLFQSQNVVKDCELRRDQLVQIPDVVKRSPYYYWGESDLPLPSQAEIDLYVKPTGANARAFNSWPEIDYTYCDSRAVMVRHDKLKIRDYANTQWIFSRAARYLSRHLIIGANWTKDQANKYRDTSEMRSLIYLRGDGLVGVNNIFDSRHRWSFQDGKITLSFFDGSVVLSMQPNVNEYGSSHYLKARDDILYNYSMSLHMGYWSPSYVKLDIGYLNSLNAPYGPPRTGTVCSPATNQTAKQTTPPRNSKKTVAISSLKPDGEPPAKVAAPQNLKDKVTLEPLNKKADRSIKSSQQPFILPEHAHIRVDTVNPNMPIPVATKAMWNKGFYIQFRKDGVIGFNTDDPGPYFFSPINKWRVDEASLTLVLDKFSYKFISPKQGSGINTRLDTLDSESGAFKMHLVFKGKSQR
jgi:hypothetical protein